MLTSLMASKKYIKDYDLVEFEDEQGRIKQTVIYKGDYFTLNLEERQIKQSKRVFIILAFAVMLVHIAAGFVANPGTYKFYVALPYTIAFLPIFFLIMAAFRLPGEKRRYRKEEIGLSFDRIRKTSFLYLILTAVGLLGMLAYMFFFRGDDPLSPELVFFALLVISALVSWWIYQKVRSTIVNKEEEPDKTE